MTFELFSYVNGDNINRLAYTFLLRKEEPRIIAVVAGHLRPELAKALLTELPDELQAKIATEAPSVPRVSVEQVQAMAATVKENLDFVAAGIERLAAMLEQADSTIRNDIIEYLKRERPSLYAKVRKHMLVFDDIVGFSDVDMRIAVRELRTELMARALQNASPELANKFFANMSAGAGSLLRECMGCRSGGLGTVAARDKIIESIKGLDKEGRISVRPKGENIMD
ncbi:MAG: hypothetical protein A2X36_05265 [Elusimicrobia bacterium GWA2_69_24]|nr:MAG: hypothetical protein A2X36_05265 [Elusimicrobia bacterium GWA2_69_24]